MTGGWLPAPGPGASVDSGSSSSFSTRRCTAARRLAEACVARSEQQELLVALARARLAAGALSRPLLTAAAWSSFSARRCSPCRRGLRAASGRSSRSCWSLGGRAAGCRRPSRVPLLTAAAWSSSSARGGAGRGQHPEQQALLVALAGAQLVASAWARLCC